jgi:outer membrane protein assembly factor BamD (BamD/ComL family)
MIIYLIILILGIGAHAEPITPEAELAVDNSCIEFGPNMQDMQLVFAPTETEHYQKKQQLEKDFARDLPSEQEAKKRFKKYKKSGSKKTVADGTKRSFWSSITISDMSFTELLQRKNELILTGDYATAIKYLERMLKLAENTEQIIYIMLEMAELFMQTGDYKKAEVLFCDFTRLYPGNEYAELAFVKAIECSWNQTLRFDRDQSKTEETVGLIQEFNSRKDIYSSWAIDRATKIKELCDQKLAQSSISIAKNDLGLAKYKEVHKRVDDLRSTVIIQLPDIEPQLLEIEIGLAQAEHHLELKEQKMSELQKKFPEHEITLSLTAPKRVGLQEHNETE